MMIHSPVAPSDRLALPQVTLCAAASVNVKATMRALQTCLEQVAFAGCQLFTDVPVEPEHPGIHVIPIDRLTSTSAYSHFLLTKMVDYIETTHCLVAQWDGHVLDAKHWRSEFLDYDYIGATWPQFDDGHNVGNGGFSLRSRRLMEVCRHPEFNISHPEDVAIARSNRDWLEGRGMRFASAALADLFAAERTGDLKTSFGYHGVFNMPSAIGVEAFWEIYGDLDNRGTVFYDFMDILKKVRCGRGGIGRTVRMIGDRLRWTLRKNA